MDKKTQVAIKQGKSYFEAIELMKKETAWASNTTDDYIITVACEKAEGMYMPNEVGKLAWKIPKEGENQHVEVVVQDKKDGRFIPSLNIKCKLSIAKGEYVGEKDQPFLWHPFLYHYGTNWEIPGENEYIAEVTVNQPEFGRHDEEVGKRYLGLVRVEVGPLRLKPGRREHGPE